MKDTSHVQHVQTDKQAMKSRKPFVAPALRREAGLTEVTAERTFTFTSAS